MEYYGSYAASTAPLPNIYRQRHKSSSERGGGTAEAERGTRSSPSTSSSITATADSAPDRKSTSTRSRNARTSSSSEFSSRSRGSHDQQPPPLPSTSLLSRAATTGSDSSSGKKRPPPKKTPNKIKRKSTSRSFQQQPPQTIPPSHLPTTSTPLQSPPPPPSTKPPPPPPPQPASASPYVPPISSPRRPPPPTPSLATSGTASAASPAATPQTSRSPSSPSGNTYLQLAPASQQANILSDAQHHPPASPTSLPNSKIFPSHPPRTSSATALASHSVPVGTPPTSPTTPSGPSSTAAGARTPVKPLSTATTAATTEASLNAGGGIEDLEDFDEPTPPRPPPKTPPARSTAVNSDPRMLANTGKQAQAQAQAQAKHQKQLPALPSQPAFSAPLPPLPRSVTVARAAATAAAFASGSGSASAPAPVLSGTTGTSTNSHHHPHLHLRHPSPVAEDRQQHHAAMLPEPGTPNPSTPSTSSQQPPHLPLQPQALSRFNVPFARTESVVSSTSAATTLSSRTMQSSDPPSASSEEVSSRPFIVRNGRTLLNDPTLPYPLPVDLPELHRQSLRTLLLVQLFGGPVCSPAFQSKPPSRVLEVGCGSGFWSMVCHRYFSKHGHSNISFTGVDIAPLSSSSNSPGGDARPDRDMKWRFVQHDLRRTPWPFQDGEFDLIMVKDMSLATGTATQQSQMDEVLRLLKAGGTLEIWESDHTIRMLRPHMPSPLAEDEDLDNAASLGAYVMTANTPLSAPLNNFLVEYNSWISKAFDARSISTVPCTTMGPMLLQESELLVDVRSRRLAVPLSEMRWEREGVGGVVTKDGKSYIETKGKSRGTDRRAPLSAGQVALRRTALLTVVQMIQSLEPVLREIGGKSQDEWDGWAGKMMGDLMGGGTAWGECLEVGAWWAKKRT